MAEHKRPTPAFAQMLRSRAFQFKAAALVLVLVATSLWVVVEHSVTVTVDGATQHVRTRAADVRTLLGHLGHTLGERDEVSPSPSADLRDNLSVRLNRARKLTLTVDGSTREHWVTVNTVGDALEELSAPTGSKDAPVRVSVQRDTTIPLDGMRVRVSTLKKLTLTQTGHDAREFSTYASSVQELLKSEKITLGEFDRTEPELNTPLTQGMEIRVRHLTHRREVEKVTTPAGEEITQDPSLMLDQRRVTSSGHDGVTEETVEYFEENGEVVERRVIEKKVLREAEPKKITEGSKPYPGDDTGLNWSALAQCESGGRASVVSANGMYHGLYQFSVQTWQSVGGLGVPSQATPREQTYRAILLYKRSGAGQWPECGPRLFS